MRKDTYPELRLFIRVFTSLFLLVISGSVFAAGSAGGDTVTKWYQGNRSSVQICETDLSIACTARYGGGANTISVTCDALRVTNVYRNAAGGQSVYTDYHDLATNTKTCTAPQVFNLNKTTCAGTCVTPPPEPCADKVGQTVFGVTVACGTTTCPSGGVIVAGSPMACSNGKAWFTPSPAPSIGLNGCLATNPKNASTNAMVKTGSAGSSTTTAYCRADYTYTGSSGADTQVESGLTDLSFLGVTPTTADGACPPNTTKGVFGGGEGSYVCYPNSSTPPTNPTTPSTDPTSTTNPDGSVTKTSASSKTNPDGSVTKTTTKETTNPDGSKSNVSKSVTNNTNNTTTTQTTTTNTTKEGVTQTNVSTVNSPTTNNNTNNNNTTNHTTNNTTTLNPDGSVTHTPSQGSDSSSSQNADGTSSGSGGGGSCPSGGCSADTSSTCSTPPTCSGDPLVCASINQQWISTCKQTEALTKVTSDDKTASDGAISSANGEYAAAQASANSQASSLLSGFQNSVSSGSHSGHCINDVSLGVMGKTMTIPFSLACSFFKFLRMIVIFVSYLAAMRIVFKGTE